MIGLIDQEPNQKESVMRCLTSKQRETLADLAHFHPNGASACDLSFYMFGERYGILASRARGRLMTLKRLGLAVNDGGIWRMTKEGAHVFRTD